MTLTLAQGQNVLHQDVAPIDDPLCSKYERSIIRISLHMDNLVRVISNVMVAMETGQNSMFP